MPKYNTYPVSATLLNTDIFLISKNGLGTEQILPPTIVTFMEANINELIDLTLTGAGGLTTNTITARSANTDLNLSGNGAGTVFINESSFRILDGNGGPNTFVWLMTNAATAVRVINWHLKDASFTIKFAPPTTINPVTLNGNVPGDVVITGTTHDMVANEAYIHDNSSLGTYTLPPTFNVGDIFKLRGVDTGQWKIAQRDGQQIFHGSQSTTSGTGGYIASQVTPVDAPHTSITLVGAVANTILIVDALNGLIDIV